MQKSESLSNLAKALASFQSEVKNPANTANNPFYKSKYAPLPDILNDVRPLLAKHGLSILQAPSGDGEKIIITTLLMHESGEWIETCPLILKAEKVTAQGAGSAITYGRRYALAAVLGLSSEDDDDGNHAEKPTQVKPDQKPQSPKENIKKQEQSQQQAQPQTQQQKSQPTGDLSSEAQHKAIHTIANKFNKNVVDIIGVHYGVESVKELTKKQASELIEMLQKGA